MRNSQPTSHTCLGVPVRPLATNPAKTHEPGIRTADVLLVDDDDGDVLLITEAFERSGSPASLHVAGDGEQALQFLHRTGGFASAPRPGLVLLDLNLPRRAGLEVLADVKSYQDLRSIPVVILTTSQAEDDIARSYSMHANAYVAKPVDFERFSDVVRQVNDFFLTLAKLPS
jgi:CheY-like chemotaxis protein